MKIFKRDGYWHLEYFDERLQRLRRKSLRTKKKNEALKGLTSSREVKEILFIFIKECVISECA